MAKKNTPTTPGTPAATRAPAKTPDEVYSSALDAGVSLIQEYGKNTLHFYWKLGEEAMKVRDKAAVKYGSKVVDRFCEDLSKRTGITFAPKTVYQMIGVRERVSEEDFMKLKARNVPWGSVLLLGNKSLTEEKRAALVGDMVTGSMSRQDVQAAVKKESGRSATPPGGDDDAKEVSTALKKLAAPKNLFEMVSGKLNEVVDSADRVFRSGDEEAIKKAYNEIMAANEQFEVLAAFWDQKFETMVKAAQKIRSITGAKGESGKKSKE